MEESSGPSFGARVLAILVLAVAAWILLHVVIHVLASLATLLVIIAAVVGGLWAYRTLSS